MSNTKLLLALLITLIYAVFVGGVIPELVSDKSDVGPLLAGLVLVVLIMAPALYLNRSKKEKKDESN